MNRGESIVPFLYNRKGKIIMMELPKELVEALKESNPEMKEYFEKMEKEMEKAQKKRKRALQFVNSRGMRNRLKTFSYTMNNQPKEPKLDIRVGGGSYTDGKTVVVSLMEEFWGEKEDAYLIVLKDMIAHEYAHINFSDFRVFREFQQEVDDFFITNYSVQGGAKLGAFLLNCTEDGRIERAQANDFKGVKKYFQYVNGFLYEKFVPEEMGQVPLHDFMNTILTISKMGLLPKGFSQFKGTELEVAIDNSRPYIIEAIQSTTAKGCANATMKFIKANADVIAEWMKPMEKEMEEDGEDGDGQGQGSGEGEGQEGEGQDGNGSGQSQSGSPSGKKTVKIDPTDNIDTDPGYSTQPLKREANQGSESVHFRPEEETKKPSGKQEQSGEDEQSSQENGEEQDEQQEGQGAGNGEETGEDSSEEKDNQTGQQAGEGDSENEEESEDGEETPGKDGKSGDEEGDSEEGEAEGSGENKKDGEEKDGDSKDSGNDGEGEANQDDEKDSKDDEEQNKPGIQESDMRDGYTSGGENDIDKTDDVFDVKQALDAIRQDLKEENTKTINDANKFDESEERREQAEGAEKQKYQLNPQELSAAMNTPYGRHGFTYRNEDLTNEEPLPLDLKLRGAKFHKDLKKILMDKKGFTRTNQRAGRLDVNALWRMSMNQTDVFVKKGDPRDSDYVVSVLVDHSGSMYGDVYDANGMNIGSKVSLARESCAVLEEGLNGLIPFKIQRFDTNTTVIHREIRGWQDKSKENKSWKATLNTGGGNVDGFSIKVAVEELKKRKESQKILFVLSDGLPAGYNSDKQAFRHVNEVVTEARKSGIKVIAIRFGSQNVLEQSADGYREMYERDYITCHPQDITKEITRVLKKITQ